MAYRASHAFDVAAAAAAAAVYPASASPNSIGAAQPPPPQPPPQQPQPALPLLSQPHEQLASAVAAHGHNTGLPALLVSYHVTRRLLHAWPDTVHQFERETGLCFDLHHFNHLLATTNYSAASDYLVSFWIHPFYRHTLSRVDHSRVRHALVSVLELKLTLLSMTTDRLMIDFYIQKEMRPKLLALSMSAVDVENLIRKAYCNVRARFPLPVQSLRHTVWYELVQAVESVQQRTAEQELLTQFLKEPSIVNAHRLLVREVRSLPFHFASEAVSQMADSAAAAVARYEQLQHGRSGSEDKGKRDKRREEEKEVKQEEVDNTASSPPPPLLPTSTIPPPPVLPPIDFRQHNRHRKRPHSEGEERKDEREDRDERRKRRSMPGADREVIELDTDSDRTATDDEKDDRTNHSSASPPPTAASSSSSHPLQSSGAAFDAPLYSQSPPDMSAASSPIAADLEPLSSLIDKHRVHLSAAQLGEDEFARMEVAAGESEQKAAQEGEEEPWSPPPANPASYVEMHESTESEPMVEEEAKEEQQPVASSSNMPAETGTAAIDPPRLIHRGQGTRLGDIDSINQRLTQASSNFLLLLWWILFPLLDAYPVNGSMRHHIRDFSGWSGGGKEEEEAAREKLEKKEVKDVKVVAELLDVSTSGSKQQLIDRIVEFCHKPTDSTQHTASSDASAATGEAAPATTAGVRRGRGKRLAEIDSISQRLTFTSSNERQLILLHWVLYPLLVEYPVDWRIKDSVLNFSGWSGEGREEERAAREQLEKRDVREVMEVAKLLDLKTSESKHWMIDRIVEFCHKPTDTTTSAENENNASKWTCRVCTFHNTSARTICELCNTSSVEHGTSSASSTSLQPSLITPSSASPAPTNVAYNSRPTAEERVERKEESAPSGFSPASPPTAPHSVEPALSTPQSPHTAPPAASSSASAAPSAVSTAPSAANEWACELCTCLNPSARTRCMACSEPRPSTSSIVLRQQQPAASAASLSTPSQPSLFSSSSAASSSTPTAYPAMSGLPPPVPPAQLGRPLPPRQGGARSKQTARKSVGVHNASSARPA